MENKENKIEEKKEEHKSAGQFTHTIGKTTYIVNMYFSNTSTETIQDKILRLVRNEGLNKK